jgi:multiple sugar transport system permease protein
MSTPSTLPGRRGSRLPGSGRRGSAAAALMSPFFVLFAMVTLIPLGYAVYLSMFQDKRSGLGFGGVTTVFSGLDNYSKVLGDSVYRAGYVHVALYGCVYVPVMLFGALTLSLLLDSALARAKRVFQLFYFLPHVVPGILAALIWLYLYTPRVSPIVTMLNHSGISFNLNHMAVVVPATANIAVWEVMGYNIVIFYAALQAIPRETLEAAKIDGASEFRTAVSIKLPLIRSSAGLVGLFTAVGVLQLFNEPLMLQTVAPGSISQTWTPNMYNLNAAFNNQNVGAAAAGAIVLALVSGVVSYVITRVSNPWKTT